MYINFDQVKFTIGWNDYKFTKNQLEKNYIHRYLNCYLKMIITIAQLKYYHNQD